MSRYFKKMPAIDITTVMGCRLDCHFCPQKSLLREYKKKSNCAKSKMTLEDFSSILPQIQEGGVITFSGMSEIFQNPEASQMIKLAYEKGFRVQLFTTLMGICDEDFDALRDVRFSTVVLHIPDEEGNSKFVIDEAYLSHLKRFHENYDILYYSCHGTVHHLVKDIIQSNIPIDRDMYNRAGVLNDTSLKTFQWKGEIVCTGLMSNTEGKAIGHIPVLLPDGTLLACPNDYEMELVLGNLYKSTWEDILLSDAYARIENALDDDAIDSICRRCHRALPKAEAIGRESNIMWNHALKVGRCLDAIERGQADINLLGKQNVEWVDKLLKSRNVCIFGLGKLFSDTFDKVPWRNVILSDKKGICSDNSTRYANGDYVGGLRFIKPSDLKNVKDLCIVTYVAHDDEIVKQLNEMGIKDIVNIYDIFNLA